MHRVEWLRSALEELAAAWTQADPMRRRAMTEAADRIDRELRDRPEDQGESRPGNRRITFFPPLGITFFVEGRTTVVVSHVWPYQTRP